MDVIMKSSGGSDLMRNVVVMAGTSNEPLGRAIIQDLGLPKNILNVKRFADGEIFIKVEETIRGKDVFIVQSTSTPVNESLMELLLCISTCRRASVKRISAIIPYYGYARQDRKVESRTPISAADVATLICAMGVDRVVGVDIHCAQIQGFFPPHIPMDNLETHSVAIDWYTAEGKLSDQIAVVSPDAGGVYRARNVQQGLIRKGKNDVVMAMLIKHRPAPNQIGRMDLVGDVRGRDAVIIDDIVDTGGTLCEAAKKLKENGATRVFAFISHGIFSGPCVERIANSVLEELVVTDTIVPAKHEEAKQNPKIKYISIAHMLAVAIARIQKKESISDLWRAQPTAVP